MISSLAATRPFEPSVTLLRYTSGVFPMSSETSEAMLSLVEVAAAALTEGGVAAVEVEEVRRCC